MLLRTLGPPGDAKLVRPPGLPAAAKPPKPDPSAPNPEAPAEAKGEGPSAAANPVAAGFSPVVSAGFLKTDVVEEPMAPKGDCSEPAKAARLEDANAEEVVTFFLEGSSSLDVGRAPNGETAEVLENALVIAGCQTRSITIRPKSNQNTRIDQPSNP